MKLETLDSVSEEDAETLRRNDVDYVGDLAKTPCQKIEDMGFKDGSQMVADALEAKDYTGTFVKPDTIGYQCNWCGHESHGIKKMSHERHVKECEQNPKNQTESGFDQEVKS